jgi:hypothetical protein
LHQLCQGQQTVIAEVSTSWNMQRSDSNAKVTLELTNQVESAQTTRTISIALTLTILVREMLLSTSYVMGKDRFAHEMEVQLEAGGKLSYDIDLSRLMKRNLITIDGKIAINSQMKATTNHKVVNNKQHVTQIAIKSATQALSSRVT